MNISTLSCSGSVECRAANDKSNSQSMVEGDQELNQYFVENYCEAQARVRQGLARYGSQGERPQSLNPSLELTLKLVDPPSHRKSHYPQD